MNFHDTADDVLTEAEADQLAAQLRTHHPDKAPGEAHTAQSHQRRVDQFGRPLTIARRDGEHARHQTKGCKE